MEKKHEKKNEKKHKEQQLWHSLKLEEVFEKLNTSKKGLKEKEAEKRLEKYGENLIKVEKRINPFKIFLDQFKSLLILILLIAAIVSFILGFLPGEGSDFIDAILIISIVFANGIFGFIQDYKAEKSILALKKLSAKYAIVLRNGKKKRIDSKKLVPGDVIFLNPGDIIPADSRIIQAFNLKVDESMLTGESIPVNKFPGVLEENTSLDSRTNILYMNTVIKTGTAQAIIFRTGKKTEVGKIAEDIERAEPKKTPFQEEIQHLGKKITVGLLIIILIIFLAGIFIRHSPILGTFILAISLAVAAIPEGLPAVVTISLAIGARKLLKRNALMRKLPIIESLGSVDMICTDKTGTLTENKMTVQKILFNSKTIELKGNDFFSNNKKIDPEELKLLLECGMLCNNSEISYTENIGDPTELALLDSGKKSGLNLENLKKKYEKIDEISFSSERKLMTTIHRTSEGVISFTKGAPEVLLQLCNRIYEDGEIKPLNSKRKQEILKINEKFASEALRVLGFAYKNLKKEDKENAEKNMIFLGLQGMLDPPRDEVYEAIRDCRTAGIRVIILTGDNKLTALAIAKKLGFRSTEAVEGKDIEKLSDSELKELLKTTDIFARVSPHHKTRILRLLKQEHIVAMTGDGVNDAPALKNSNVGISMGLRGTEIAKESSDMILLDDNFKTIRNSIAEGRGIFNNIRKFVNYLLSANLGEVLLIFLATLFGLGLPLIATQLLWINLVTDGLPAVALGSDPTPKNIMRKKPRSKKEGIINKRMIFSIFSIGSMMALILVGLFYFNNSNLIKAQTIVFTAVVIFEMVRIQAVRSRYGDKVFSNKWLVLAVLSSIILQLGVLYTPLNTYFKVIPLGILEWGQILLGLMFFLLLTVLSQKIENRFFKKESV